MQIWESDLWPIATMYLQNKSLCDCQYRLYFYRLYLFFFSKRDKKIDVYKNNKKIGSVGALGYKDYPTYIKQKGLVYANKRRDLYKIRHKNDIGSGNGKLAYQLLWS